MAGQNGNPSPVSNGSLGWDDEVDVIVLGTGAAGLTAALAAAANGARVAVCEKAATVGGTTAVSGGIAWVPAHDRAPNIDLPVEDALQYLRAQALGSMDEALVETYVRTAPHMLDFVEAHSELKFRIADGFPDYKPELPGGKATGGRSLGPAPYPLDRLGAWGDRITSFPPDFSNVGFDAETRARLDAAANAEEGDVCVAGTALVAGLLKGLLDLGVEPRLQSRALELVAGPDGIVGVVLAEPSGERRLRASRGVILATGGFEWDRDLVGDFLRGPMHGPVSPPANTGDGLRMAMAHGAALGNMGEAWWVPVIKIPGDTFNGQPRARSVRLERTRPRCIMVNRLGRRFVNEACDYNSMGGAFHYLDPREGYVNDPAWMVFDAQHLKRYGFLSVEPGGQAPNWFFRGETVEELATASGIDPAGLSTTVENWNKSVARGYDPEFGRGQSAYDGWWGDDKADTLAGRTLGPLDEGPYYAVPMTIGAMGTKGGPRVDRDGLVQHVSGGSVRGLYAAGNAMAGATGKAYGGAGGTIGPAMTWGFRAGHTAATGRSFQW
ncbi:FAD-dependent oxidoreductase [Amorphus sp. 3PC139-8]|uniref:FAD-dependent oxidoreductase n=1 Tax=Amorphus sp. 3PC139-8 TaxID=2735676 RepID=UPI00345CA20B